MPKILIVDDEPDTAKMLGLMLGMHGYETVVVHGTAAAMNAVAREKPDAIVLDVMMPDLSGLELCRYVRRDPATSQTPIVIVSARVRPEDVREGLQAGATTYLTKPVSQAELVQAVSDSIARDR